MKKLLITALMHIVLGFNALAGDNWFYHMDSEGLALQGYDPVSYFDYDQPEKGEAELKFIYEGVIYQFVNQQNIKKFRKNPDRYLPQYGGWCAYRLGHIPEEEGWGQSRIPADPRNYKMIDGKLYLFSKTSQTNGLNLWEAHDEKEMISRADEFWQSRVKLASLVNVKPAGLNQHARMENLLWDRLMGKWNGEGHQLVDTLTKKYVDFPSATWTFRYGYDGFCIQDDWLPDINYGGTYSGPAIRGYDPLKKEWHMTFIPINAGRSATWLMKGNFDENLELEGYFEGTDAQGRSFKQKIYFYNIQNDRFSWKADRSYDGGATWIEKFTYTECERLE